MPLADIGGNACRAAANRLPAPSSSARAMPGAAVRRPVVAAEPAYTPPSNGSTSRATTCGPNRRATRSATVGSAPTVQCISRWGSLSMRATVSSSTSPTTDDAEAGMPFTVLAGSGCKPPPA
ncbi:Uncharacterised protein [Mycobacteroides abscessus subsp. abscessus]|nr:Uncharacterised protein [Mycobacteroides abscessus subsp. abscessus]